MQLLAEKIIVTVGFLWLVEFVLGLLEAKPNPRKIVLAIALVLLIIIFWTPFLLLHF